LSNYISSATQASLLILCFPLLIIKNLLTGREIAKMADQERLRFVENNITFPCNVTLGEDKFHFEKVVAVTAPEKNFIFTNYGGNYKIVFIDDNILVMDYFRKEINLIIQVKYSRNLKNDSK
jgi:hypothetical protein